MMLAAAATSLSSLKKKTKKALLRTTTTKRKTRKSVPFYPSSIEYNRPLTPTDNNVLLERSDYPQSQMNESPQLAPTTVSGSFSCGRVSSLPTATSSSTTTRSSKKKRATLSDRSTSISSFRIKSSARNLPRSTKRVTNDRNFLPINPLYHY